jgi:hypothetical protein
MELDIPNQQTLINVQFAQIMTMLVDPKNIIVTTFEVQPKTTIPLVEDAIFMIRL